MNTLFAIILASIQIMSFNIRVGTASDGNNDWSIRRPASVQMILDQKPDIVGLQEAMDFQVAYLQENCRGYAAIGVGRDNGGTKGEHMTIFYRKSTVQCLSWGTFWLSETPDKASKGWDGAYPRTATWALMKDKRSGNLFYMVNTHLDHVGYEARSKGLALIEEMIAAINVNNHPVVLTGDFNCTVDFPALKGIRSSMKNSRETARTSDSTLSYNAWGEHTGSNIDFVWYSGFSDCTWFRTITKTYGNIPYVSDHYPVAAELVF